MSARDELAKLLGDHESMGCGCCAYGPTTSEQSSVADSLEVSDYMVVLADAILAAGYSKPRTISTVEELDALPSGSVILDSAGEPNVFHDNGWVLPGGGGGYTSWAVAQSLPATVLYTPKES